MTSTLGAVSVLSLEAKVPSRSGLTRVTTMSSAVVK